MENQNRFIIGATIATGYLLSIAMTTTIALAHPDDGEEAMAKGTFAWLGCWRLDDVADGVPEYLADDAADEVAREDGVPEPAGVSQLLCVSPGEASDSLALSAIVDGEVVAQENLVADGSRQTVGEGGCSGWKRSMLSKDRLRLYRQSETTCEDGNRSELSGASLIVSNDQWVDVNVTRVGGEQELVIRRYRMVGTDLQSTQLPEPPAYLSILPGALPDAGQTARIAAAAPLEVDEIVEALEHLDPAVVEALIVESGTVLAMDSRLLLQLDDAGIPGPIVDLLMAQAYPNYFAVQNQTIVARPVVYYDYWSPWFHGLGYGYGYVYGYGHYHYPGYDYPDHDPDSRPRPEGRAIKGRGYTRVRPTAMPSGGVTATNMGTASSAGGSAGAVSSGPGSESGGSASKSGYSGDGTSIRRAVPK